MARDHMVLTESQVQALERKKEDDKASGEIETANDIEHIKTKVRSPQTNGICERFHKTMLQELYQVTFRKKIYRDIETLQYDLDLWLEEYNHRRTHQGKMSCGRTPMVTLEDGK